MPYRIEVGLKQGIRDTRGEKIRRRIVEDLELPVENVRTIDVYTVDAGLTLDEIRLVASEPFTDSVIQEYTIDQPLAREFDYLVEVAFRPGVTDNIGRTAREAIEYTLNYHFKENEGVFKSTQYLLQGKLTLPSMQKISEHLLANTLIEHFRIKGRDEWDAQKGIESSIPKVTLKAEGRLEEIDLNRNAEELLQISRARLLALSLQEMQAIQDYISNEAVQRARQQVGLGKNITDMEIEAIAQTWSEHCKHKIFSAKIDYRDESGKQQSINSLFKTYIVASTEIIRRQKGRRDFCISVFKDNAGVIRFDKDHYLVFKVETHNSPSALDPYGGALTGIVGVNRDALGTGLGARLILNTDVFCFASPFYTGEIPPRLMHPRRIFEGVREGVEHGGNKSGIPTVNGSLVFDDRFLGKPLVYCGTAGLLPARLQNKDGALKQAQGGDLVVAVGGRTGKDGIHGATFSSEVLHAGSPVTAVQIGDPITQKRMSDFLIQARDAGLYQSITDNGAGGFSSSIGEMARESGGVELELQNAPLKYAGLEPWEIFLSEAQERMTLAVPPRHLDAFLSLAKKRGVEATVLGQFNNSGKLHVKYKGKTAAYLDMDFLHKGCPQMRLKAVWQKKEWPEPVVPEPKNLGEMIQEMLARLNICSKERIVRQYDHEVQGGSVIKPLTGVKNDGPSDAGVVRPVLSSKAGVVVAHGICPRYSDIDTYAMMANSIDEAIRNALCVGGNLDYLAGLDNFCWCDPVQSEKTPDGEYKLAQLVRANQALYDYTVAYGVPCISGKDSMKNDYQIGETKISIPPTVLFSVIGKIEDVTRCVTLDAKQPGDLVYLLGMTYAELGGSEYFAKLGFRGQRVPRVDAKTAAKLYRALSRSMQKRFVASCHDCSDGGLGVALAEVSFAGGLGMEIDLRKVPTAGLQRNDSILFSESASRFVVTVRAKNQKVFEKIFKGNLFAKIGKVARHHQFSVIGMQGKKIIQENIETLKKSWQKTLGA